MSVALQIGVVVIGRNEGARLIKCLASVPKELPLVYVDSASTDGSIANAQAAGASVVELDMSIPFSAARARNEGVQRLLDEHPNLEAVQFLDGDTELQRNWLPAASQALIENAQLAVVAGRRRERFPDASWYNRLCDYEWDTPVGEAAAIGGDALYRLEPFRDVGGFNPTVVAGEEPELCLRLRRNGYGVYRLDEEMTLHDADIQSFSSWWKRAVRSGYAYCLGAVMHGRGAERYNVKETLRALLWGGIGPLLFIVSLVTGNALAAFLMAGLYGAKFLRMYLRFRGEHSEPAKYALFLMLTNVAEVQGILRCLWETLRSQDRKILEYK